jgi:hypothetical protein
MYGEHVVENLSVYLNGGLSKQESERIADHLIGCTFCRLEFEQIKFETVLTEKSPALGSRGEAVMIPLTRTIPGRTGERDHGEEIRGWFKKLENRYFTVALVIAVLISTFALYVMHSPSAVPSIEVLTTSGAPVLGAVRVKGRVELELGQWLETDSVSTATVMPPDGPELQVESGTRIGLIGLDQMGSRFALQRGRVKAVLSSPVRPAAEERSVSIDTPAGSLSGCASYTAEVNDKGAATVHVQSGFLEARLAGKKSIVPGGASCEMRPEVGPGAPFFDDASERFRDAVETLDFGTGGSASDTANPIGVLAGNSRERDALTLWHLLKRVNDNQRVIIFERLKELAPLPSGITREATLNLDEGALGKWLVEIERRTGLPAGRDKSS